MRFGARVGCNLNACQIRRLTSALDKSRELQSLKNEALKASGESVNANTE